MSNDLLGTLMDAGLSPQDARELFGDYADGGVNMRDPGNPMEPVVQTLLTVARDDRQSPPPQLAVPSGVLNSLPDSQAAAPVRVDTEDTYQDWRGGGKPSYDLRTVDDPENSQSVPDMLNDLAQEEAGLTDMPSFQRGTASEWPSQWLTGGGSKRRHSRVGDIMSRGVASQNSLFDYPLSQDQTCVFCGAPSGGSAACANCLSKPAIIGLFERGAASALYDPNPTSRFVRPHTLVGADFYRLQRHLEEQAIVGGNDDFTRMQYQLEEVLGAEDAAEFYRLQSQVDESATMLGADDSFYRMNWQTQEKAIIGAADFYRMNWQTQERAIIGDDGAMYSLDRFADETSALAAPSDAPAEAIPMSFSQPDADANIATWKQGPNLYASMRTGGWDGRPRVLTASTPYANAVATVVGYAQRAGIPPAQTLAVLDPLARTLGASQLIPRLAAAAPAVLSTAHGKVTPLVFATMPVTNHRVDE